MPRKRKLDADGKPIPKRPATGRPFVPGDPRIGPLMVKAAEANGEVLPSRVRVEVVPATSAVLTAYRHVLENPNRMVDRSGLEKTARGILDENPQKFMDRYEQLEEAERKGEESEEVVEDDVGEDRAVGMSRELFGEWKLEMKTAQFAESH